MGIFTGSLLLGGVGGFVGWFTRTGQDWMDFLHCTALPFCIFLTPLPPLPPQPNTPTTHAHQQQHGSIACGIAHALPAFIFSCSYCAFLPVPCSHLTTLSNMASTFYTPPHHSLPTLHLPTTPPTPLPACPAPTTPPHHLTFPCPLPAPRACLPCLPTPYTFYYLPFPLPFLPPPTHAFPCLLFLLSRTHCLPTTSHCHHLPATCFLLFHCTAFAYAHVGIVGGFWWAGSGYGRAEAGAAPHTHMPKRLLCPSPTFPNGVSWTGADLLLHYLPMVGVDWVVVGGVDLVGG